MKHVLCCVVLFLAGTLVAPAGTVPDLKLPDLGGRAQKLSALRGNIVVLSFWATWCTPCQEELPRLSKLSESYKGKPVRFVAASIDEPKDRAKIAPWLTREAIQLEVWTGANIETMARLGLGEIVPSTLILDEQGNAITRIEGEAQQEDVSSRVDWLLAGRLGPVPERRLRRY